MSPEDKNQISEIWKIVKFTARSLEAERKTREEALETREKGQGESPGSPGKGQGESPQKSHDGN